MLATPLVMASVAQTVAAGGVRTVPSLRPGGSRRSVRVTNRRVARTLEELMVDVVEYGTGTAAALPDVKVAGKTGTAELEDTRESEPGEELAAGPDQHRRLVHRLRTGRAAPDRGRGAAGAGGRGRRDRGAGGADRARRRALASSAGL